VRSENAETSPSSSAPKSLAMRNTETNQTSVLPSDGIGSAGIELLLGQLSFQPIFLQSEWLDRENGMAQRLTVSVNLPSGISADNVTPELIENGTFLEISVRWPKPILNPEKLFGPYIKSRSLSSYNSNHPEVISMEKSLKDIRSELGKMRGDDLVSSARIRLLWPVIESKVDTTIIPFTSSEEGCVTCLVLVARFYKLEEEYDDGAKKRRLNVMPVQSE